MVGAGTCVYPLLMEEEHAPVPTIYQRRSAMRFLSSGRKSKPKVKVRATVTVCCSDANYEILLKDVDFMILHFDELIHAISVDF
jgi:hypothetical protein